MILRKSGISRTAILCLAVPIVALIVPQALSGQRRDPWGDLKEGRQPQSPVPLVLPTPTSFAPVDLFDETEKSPGVEPLFTPVPAAVPEEPGFLAGLKRFFKRFIESPGDTVSETAEDAVAAVETPVAEAGEKLNELSEDAKRAVSRRRTNDIQETRPLPDDAYNPHEGSRPGDTAGKAGRAIEEQVQDAEEAVRGLFKRE